MPPASRLPVLDYYYLFVAAHEDEACGCHQEEESTSVGPETEGEDGPEDEAGEEDAQPVEDPLFGVALGVDGGQEGNQVGNEEGWDEYEEQHEGVGSRLVCLLDCCCFSCSLHNYKNNINITILINYHSHPSPVQNHPTSKCNDLSK